MPYDINTSLENLEKGLKDIQSAKKQVEKTVKTSEELQSVVSKYVTSLESLHTNVKDWVKEISSFQSSNIKGIEDSIKKISTSCDKVIKTFSASTDDLTTKLKEKIGDELGKFEGANSKLISQVDKLLGLDEHLKTTTTAVNIVKEKLDEMLKELKDSQKDQDKTLDALKKVQDGLSTKTDNVLNSCKSILQAQGILDQKVESLRTQLSAIIQDVNKEVNINRWIMVAGIIILTVLLFVCK